MSAPLVSASLLVSASRNAVWPVPNASNVFFSARSAGRLRVAMLVARPLIDDIATLPVMTTTTPARHPITIRLNVHCIVR
jgi:hypothetical protein